MEIIWQFILYYSGKFFYIIFSSILWPFVKNHSITGIWSGSSTNFGPFSRPNGPNEFQFKLHIRCFASIISGLGDLEICNQSNTHLKLAVFGRSYNETQVVTYRSISNRKSYYLGASVFKLTGSDARNVKGMGIGKTIEEKNIIVSSINL